MAVLEKKRDIRALAALSVAVYFASYLTRVNFTAVLVEFSASEGVLKSGAAFVTGALALSYGAGQLVSGKLGDRLDPRKLIFFGLLSSAVMNLLLPLVAPNIPLMTAVWALNGLFQAFMWPPLVKILLVALRREDYEKVVPLISFGSGGGTIAVYLVASLTIPLWGWKTVFFFSFGAAVIALILWALFAPRLTKNCRFDLSSLRASPQKTEERASYGKKRLLLIALLLTATVAAGMLREGLNQWTPSILTETFSLPTNLSILTVAGLQIFHILCNLFTGKLLEKSKKGCVFLIALFFLLFTLFLVPLVFFGSASVGVLLFLLMLAAIPANSINFLEASALPADFPVERASWISGLLNFATYFGSALSAYVFSRFSERFGWTATFGMWTGISAAGFLFSLWALFIQKKGRRPRPQPPEEKNG